MLKSFWFSSACILSIAYFNCNFYLIIAFTLSKHLIFSVIYPGCNNSCIQPDFVNCCELDLFYVFAGFPELSLTLQEIIQTKKDVPQSCGWKNTKFTCKLHKNCQADKFLLAGKIYIFSIVYLTGSSSQPVWQPQIFYIYTTYILWKQFNDAICHRI